MKAFVDFHDPYSFAILRVVKALKEYAPKGLEFVSDKGDADFIVHHTVGRLKRLTRIINDGRPFAAIQYTLRGSRNKNAADWMPYWSKAKVVWSYLDLAMLSREDGVNPDFNFYHAPLGVDNRIFRPTGAKKEYAICTSGGLYMTECVRECHIAANRTGGKIVHLGPSDVGAGRGFECYRFASDETIASVYNRCEFVAGLRRTEGFELPAAEGLLCGARPIVFDSPHYRHWYDGFAEFIHENGRDEVVESLYSILTKDRKPVTDNEIEEAKRRFDWEKIVSGFWEKCLWE